jgi:hypothetical protein
VGFIFVCTTVKLGAPVMHPYYSSVNHFQHSLRPNIRKVPFFGTIRVLRRLEFTPDPRDPISGPILDKIHAAGAG